MIYKTGALVLALMAAVVHAGEHNWQFDAQNVVANFGNGENNEFAITITNGDSLTDANKVIESLYNHDCVTQGDLAGLTASESTVTGTTTTATVDVAFDSLGVDVWNSTDDTHGTIMFCYKSEIQMTGEGNAVMNYVEIQVTATFDLESGYPQVTSIAIQDKSPLAQDSLTASINYPLASYRCNGSNNLDASPAAIQPGGSVRACIEYQANLEDGITLDKVFSASLSQSGTAVTDTAIAAGATSNSWTTTACPETRKCYVETVIVGAFFGTPNNVAIDGTALFKIGSRRRMEEVSLRGGRQLNSAPVTATGDFELPEIALDGSTDSSAGSNGLLLAGAALAAFALI